MPTPATKWEQMVDRAAGACARVFGEGRDADGGKLVWYQHRGTSVPYRVDGIFDATTEEVDLETGSTVLSNKPRLSIQLSELQQTPQTGDTVTIRGKGYQVIEPMFDGQGNAILRLHVVASSGGESS